MEITTEFMMRAARRLGVSPVEFVEWLNAVKREAIEDFLRTRAPVVIHVDIADDLKPLLPLVAGQALRDAIKEIEQRMEVLPHRGRHTRASWALVVLRDRATVVQRGEIPFMSREPTDG